MAETAVVTPPVKAEAPKPGAVAAPGAPVKPEEATEDYIVSGKTVKLTKAQAKAYVQKGMFADQKLKSVDALQKGTQGIIDALKTPEGVIKLLQDKALGNSPKAVLKALLSSSLIDDEAKEDLSKWVYDNVVQKAKLSPEQIEQDKKLSDYERLKRQEEDRKQKDLTAQQQQQIQQVYQAVRTEVTKQILADKTFPQTEGSIRSVVEKLRVMNKKGAPITAENITKALGLVKKDHLMHQQELFDKIEDAEDLIKFFGEERALKISRALVARLKNKEKAKGKEEKKEEVTRTSLDEDLATKFGTTKHGYRIFNY